MEIALDLWCKMLYGIPDTGQGGVWRAVAEIAADITLEQDRQFQKEREARS